MNFFTELVRRIGFKFQAEGFFFTEFSGEGTPKSSSALEGEVLLRNSIILSNGFSLNFFLDPRPPLNPCSSLPINFLAVFVINEIHRTSAPLFCDLNFFFFLRRFLNLAYQRFQIVRQFDFVFAQLFSIKFVQPVGEKFVFIMAMFLLINRFFLYIDHSNRYIITWTYRLFRCIDFPTNFFLFSYGLQCVLNFFHNLKYLIIFSKMFTKQKI